nr:MAG TPA: hypothetical protein [Caudoviricetes sp.]
MITKRLDFEYPKYILVNATNAIDKKVIKKVLHNGKTSFTPDFKLIPTNATIRIVAKFNGNFGKAYIESRIRVARCKLWCESASSRKEVAPSISGFDLVERKGVFALEKKVNLSDFSDKYEDGVNTLTAEIHLFDTAKNETLVNFIRVGTVTIIENSISAPPSLVDMEFDTSNIVDSISLVKQLLSVNVDDRKNILKRYVALNLKNLVEEPNEVVQLDVSKGIKVLVCGAKTEENNSIKKRIENEPLHQSSCVAEISTLDSPVEYLLVYLDGIDEGSNKVSLKFISESDSYNNFPRGDSFTRDYSFVRRNPSYDYQIISVPSTLDAEKHDLISPKICISAEGHGILSDDVADACFDITWFFGLNTPTGNDQNFVEVAHGVNPKISTINELQTKFAQIASPQFGFVIGVDATYRKAFAPAAKDENEFFHDADGVIFRI